MCSIVAIGALAVALLAAPNAQAAIPGSLKSSCATMQPATGYSYKFCNDGTPTVGGRTPNLTGANAVLVPARYQPTGGDDFTGLPPSAGDITMAGADTTGNIALDVDISIPTISAPTGGYPLLVFMHGCCAGDRTGWEATSFDTAGEKWHYNNAWFASRGYVVINYTARGFVNSSNQGSTGEAQLDSRRFEINDFQNLACQVAGDSFFNVNPQKVVTTGGSYGGGFSWLSFTDPKWTCPVETGAGGTNMKLAATAPKYGWTDLVYSLLPTGRHFQTPDLLPPFDGSASTGPLGIPKKTINDALYASGTTGTPPGFSHTTFPPSIDQAFACLVGSYPFNPACEATLGGLLVEFICDRSAYYQGTNCQSSFFDNVASDPSYRTPVFNSATFTDPLFTPIENLRMSNRLESIVPNYPIQQYFGDYQHFVQNKAKEWGDLCGSDHHVCTVADYGGNLNSDPTSLFRTGVTTRLNRFIDHYTQPPGNPSQPAPAFDVTASLQICPDNADPSGIAANEPGETFTAGSFFDLAPYTLQLDMSGAQTTQSDVEPNTHAINAEPVTNSVARGGVCPVETAPAEAGIATYTSDPLTSQATMIGATKVSIDFSATTSDGLELNSRLYDVFPDGKAVMVDRGPRRVSEAERLAGTVEYQLHGNGWRFPAGHRIRIEIAQDDDPYLKSSNVPSSATLEHVGLAIPVREPSADLFVTNFFSLDTVSTGALLTYTAVVTNNGPQTASDITLIDTRHRSLRIRSVRSSQGRCYQRSRSRVVCRLIDLAAGDTATVTMVVRPTRIGTFTSTATASASQPIDRVPANNIAAATTVVP